jgi:hypothetical protein
VPIPRKWEEQVLAAKKKQKESEKANPNPPQAQQRRAFVPASYRPPHRQAKIESSHMFASVRAASSMPHPASNVAQASDMAQAETVQAASNTAQVPPLGSSLSRKNYWNEGI